MSKQPVIALVGRPNVGKSTLFNRLTRSRDALVANIPGLTRDRQYGIGTHEERSFIVVDTGGLSGEIEGIDSAMAEQTKAAVAEADIVLLLVDGRAGMTSGDAAISQELREQGKAICLVVNKTDGLDPAVASSEFYALGIEKLASISASHGRGVNTLLAMLFAELPEEEIKESAEQDERIKVAIIGRPNVGKSTLVNRLLGEERVVVFDYPGTTRDSIFVPFERDGSSYTLIDTAGLRRRARVSETVEKFSVVKALQALHEAHVVVVVLDARQGISVQDASLLGLVVESGRGVVIAINKWDNLSRDEKDEARTGLSRKLDFIDYADRHFISALHGTGVGNLLDSINNAFKSAMSTHVTSRLTRILEDAVSAHQPPMVGSGRIKLRYAHQGGKNPPLVVIHGSRVDKVPAAYSRYLSNTYRKVLKLAGTPLRIEFRASENPYQDKRNKLTPRQERSRKRLIRHVKRKR